MLPQVLQWIKNVGDFVVEIAHLRIYTGKSFKAVAIE
jgi:hypothetical protein